MPNPTKKIMSVDQIRAWREDLRADGKKLVMTNGCFDLLHPGHVDYLNRSRDEGDALLVAINSDQSLRENKGPTRPIIEEAGRTLMLASLVAVDAVLVFSTKDCVGLLESIQPDVYVKGGDYTKETINQDERVALDRMNCRIAFLPFLPGYSTTSIVERIAAGQE